MLFLGPYSPTNLINAIFSSKQVALKKELKALNDINRTFENPGTDEHGHTPLSLATKYSKPEIVRTIIEAGARIDQNLVNQHQSHPFIIAIQQGELEKVNIFIEYNVDTDLTYKIINTEYSLYQTPLYLAVRLGHSNIVKRLIEKKPNLEAINQIDQGLFRGETALNAAARIGDMAIVHDLVKAGAKADPTNEEVLCSPLITAIENNELVLTKFFIQIWGVDGNKSGLVLQNGRYYEQTPLYLAVRLGYQEIVDLLIGCKCEINNNTSCNPDTLSGETALHAAIRMQNLDMAIKLIKAGADCSLVPQYLVQEYLPDLDITIQAMKDQNKPGYYEVTIGELNTNVSIREEPTREASGTGVKTYTKSLRGQKTANDGSPKEVAPEFTVPSLSNKGSGSNITGVNRRDNKKAKREITFSVDSKYLRGQNIPGAPYSSGSESKNMKNYPFEVKLIALKDLRSSIKHKIQKDVFSIGDSQLTFYSAQGELTKNDNVSFVFTGRGLEALVPNHQGHRTVAVMTSQEYEQFKQQPAHQIIDVLVVNKLDSASHGNYSKLLANINARRIAAMLFAHNVNLSHCIFMDDNIKSFNLNYDGASDYNGLFNQLKQNMGELLCQSISTYSPHKKQQQTGLGCKVFMVNMGLLRTKFTDANSVFTMFYPAEMANWWGGDYFMQLMMIHNFDEDFQSILDQNLCVLNRSSKNTNACKKSLKEANQHVETAEDKVLEFFKLDLLTEEQKESIKATLKVLREGVHKNIDSHKSKNERLKSTDLMELHVRANDIAEDAEFLSIKQFNMNELKSRHLEFLRNYQLKAIEAIEQSKYRTDLLKLATGTGKTFLQIALAEKQHLKDIEDKIKRPIIIVTPYQDLVQQFFCDFIDYLIKQGAKSPIKYNEVIKISSANNDISLELLLENTSLHDKNPILIFCKDSYINFINSNKNNYDQSGLVLIDECHKFSDDECQLILEKSKSEKIIGLTATPKQNGTRLTNKPIFTYTRQDALKEQYISPFIMENFTQEYNLLNVGKLIGNISGFLEGHFHPSGQKLSELKGVIYFPNTADANSAAMALSNSGTPAIAIHSKTKHDSKKLIQEFKDNQTKEKIACAVNMLQLGYDDSELYFVIMAQNGKDANKVSQIAGRVMRGNKIGYMLCFKNPNTDNFETICDNVALQRASPEYTARRPKPIDISKLIEARKPNNPPIVPYLNIISAKVRCMQVNPRYRRPSYSSIPETIKI